MPQHIPSLVSVLASAIAAAWRSLIDSFYGLMGEQRTVYRPEAYYMRGPGPRWREKHLQGRDIAV